MQWVVNDPNGFATNLRGFAGQNLIIANQSTVDVYFDTSASASRINGFSSTGIPSGTKIDANGGQITFDRAPDNLWVRAATQTTIEVQADLRYSAPPPVYKPPTIWELIRRNMKGTK